MRFSQSALRRAAWLAVVCHVLVASGLPLPVGAPSSGGRGGAEGRLCKDRSRPFPCMDKPCGCATAEQCFANCCCLTPTERLAWARAHHVEPAVLAALERRAACTAAPAAGCCAARRGPSAPRSAPVDFAAADVCSAYRSLATAPPTPTSPADEGRDAPAQPSVILRDMLACGGVVTAWLSCNAGLPPPRVEPPAHDAFAGHLVVSDVVAPRGCAGLSVPPPRAA